MKIFKIQSHIIKALSHWGFDKEVESAKQFNSLIDADDYCYAELQKLLNTICEVGDELLSYSIGEEEAFRMTIDSEVEYNRKTIDGLGWALADLDDKAVEFEELNGKTYQQAIDDGVAEIDRLRKKIGELQTSDPYQNIKIKGFEATIESIESDIGELSDYLLKFAELENEIKGLERDNCDLDWEIDVWADYLDALKNDYAQLLISKNDVDAMVAGQK